MAKLLSLTSLPALAKNKKLRAMVETALSRDDRYVVVPVLQIRDMKGGWPADDDGIELMNALAAEGWRVVASTAAAVVMERPEEEG